VEQLIEVSHVGGAWRLDVQGGFEPTLFLSGGRAESTARRLACCFAEAGCDARVQVHDKQHVLVGDHRYFAS
jgi:hypothetical protein